MKLAVSSVSPRIKQMSKYFKIIIYMQELNRTLLRIFWNNRIFGGITKFITPGKDIVEFGKEMMSIGKFSWAYMDLLVTDDGIFLSEINLSGSNAGLKDYNLNRDCYEKNNKHL